MTEVTIVDSPIIAAIDYDTPGKHFGRLQIPYSTNSSGWGNLFVPIITVVGGDGPTALVLGGNHGDEPEGQIAALNLARDVDVADVQGRLIIIPCLSGEASAAFTRLWPSGANFNRAFPGSPEGEVHEQLADYLTRYIFPMCDVVIDIHSGGRSMAFLPFSEMHLVPDREQRRQMVAGMLAWNTEYHFIYIDVAGTGLLTREAERQKKIVVSTELAGGGQVTAEIHRLAREGLANVLRYFGVLSGSVVTRASLGLPSPTILRATHVDNYLLAPESGLLEILVPLGQRVKKGEEIGRIHFLERPDRLPETIMTPLDGIISTIRAIAPTKMGDCAAVVADVVDQDALELEGI